MNPEYKTYHPRWHRKRLPIFWWLVRPAYTKFISRELTSLAVGYAALLLLVQSWALARGQETYASFQSWLSSTPAVLLHSVVLLVLLFHTVSWLNLAPKALVLRIGGRRLPDAAVVVSHYVAWLSVSAFLAWMLIGR